MVALWFMHVTFSVKTYKYKFSDAHFTKPLMTSEKYHAKSLLLELYSIIDAKKKTFRKKTFL